MQDEGLLERDDERTALVAAVEEAARGSGRLVLVEGEAGIGKSTLLELAASHARERGARVLSARGGVFEQDFGFGVVRQLLEPHVLGADARERKRLLAGAAAFAATARPCAGCSTSRVAWRGCRSPSSSRAASASPRLRTLFWTSFVPSAAPSSSPRAP
jgi:AAA ATPase domain